jgi:hypothetical protein
MLTGSRHRNSTRRGISSAGSTASPSKTTGAVTSGSITAVGAADGSEVAMRRVVRVRAANRGEMTHLRSSVERTDRGPRRPSCHVTR